MLPRHAACVGFMLLAGSAMAQNNGQLAARTPVPKTPTERLELPADGEIRLIVKFADAVKARIDGNGRLFSVTNQNIAAVSALSDQLGISFKGAINHSLQDLAQLQTRATALSGKRQPDLGGMMFVQGPEGVMLQAAQILNEMDIVEFVEFQPQWLPTPFFGDGGGVPAGGGRVLAGGGRVPAGGGRVPAGGGGIPAGGGPTACGDPLATDCDMVSLDPFCNNLCCCGLVCDVDPDCCEVAWDQVCVNLAAIVCDDCPPLVCGEETAGSCFIAHGDFQPYCDNADCCTAVCAVDPGCCDLTWDQTCVNIADLVCVSIACGIPQAGDCFTPNDPPFPGCDDADCCDLVCDIDVFCCTTNWDDLCVNTAELVCLGGGTPNSCGDMAAGDCFEVNGSDSCDDLECCARVCAIDPLCCDGVMGGWDADCVRLAEAVCNPDIPKHDCGVVGSGSCFVTHDVEEPGCDSIVCCTIVCDFDGFCCNTTWDEICVEIANQMCGGAGPPAACGPGTGSCFVAHDPPTPGCDEDDCCTLVCTIEPSCCTDEWDSLCASIAQQECNQGPPADCGHPDTGDCFVPACGGEASCDDPFCCAVVCGLDPFCCNVTWDAICVGVAEQFCANGEGVCANPNSGPCLNSHFGPGCGDRDCCTAVCQILPICCDEEWDDLCAELAADTCDFDAPVTPDFESNQGYRSIEGYFDVCPPLPPPGVIGGGHGFDMQGLWEFGQFLIDQGIGSENLSRGKTMRIGIIEHSAWVNHEDLDNKVIPEPGQTIIHMEGALISSNHGTATLGITVAEDNGIGVTGLAPEAQGYFFPIVSVEEGGRLLNAIASALLVFEHGDVLSFSIGPAGCGTLASSTSAWVMLRMASDLGITSCISAGNDCCNLDSDDPDGAALGDSGAIVVGAGQNGAPFCRLGFSNHSDCGTGRVHCQAWGTGVATTGYGDLFNPGAEFPEQGDPNRSYTQTFGGTSSAAPMIAALTADLQGISKMFFGTPLMPEQIRGVVSGNGFLQCFVDPCDDLFGQDDDFNCFGDGDPDEEPNAIGLFPEVVTAAELLIGAGWFDNSPLIDDIDVLRGTLLSGNANSIKASDNNRLSIKSEYTEPTDNIDLGIVYLAAGQITDLLISANSDIDNVSSMTIVHEAHASNADFICPPLLSATALVFYEMYDWDFNRWSFVAFDNLAGADCLQDYPVVGPARFIRGGDGRILLRIWTLTLGGDFGGFGGSLNQPYVVRHDWIDIQVGGGGPGDVVIPP